MLAGTRAAGRRAGRRRWAPGPAWRRFVPGDACSVGAARVGRPGAVGRGSERAATPHVAAARPVPAYEPPRPRTWRPPRPVPAYGPPRPRPPFFDARVPVPTSPRPRVRFFDAHVPAPRSSEIRAQFVLRRTPSGWGRLPGAGLPASCSGAARPDPRSARERWRRLDSSRSTNPGRMSEKPQASRNNRSVS